MSRTVQKVCLVCPYPFGRMGGVQNHTLCLQKCMQEVGITVKIIAPASGKPNSDVILIGKSIAVSVNGSKGSANLSFRFSQIPNILKEERFDAVHLHNMDAIGFLWSRRIAKTARGLGIPTFLTFHGCLDANKIASLIPAPMALLYKDLFCAAIAVSPSAMDALRYFSIPKTIIPNGVDLSRFSHSLAPDVSLQNQYCTGRKILLFVGRLEKRKGLLELLRALPFLLEIRKDVLLIIVGEGPVREDAEALIQIHRLQAHVRFAGRVSDKLLPSYYALADIVCVPSLYGESFGLVLLEAMAMKKPVVAGNNRGYQEILRPFPELLVDPRKPQEIAQTIGNLLNDPVFYQGSSRRCFDRASEPQFSWMHITQKVLQVYEDYQKG